MPAMDFDEARHQTVLQEALDMDLVLQGKKVPPSPSDWALESVESPLNVLCGPQAWAGHQTNLTGCFSVLVAAGSA